MEDIVSILKHDGIGVVPTDTLYGIVGGAFSKQAVARIYTIKGRDENKPFIVLISSLTDLKKFGVTLTSAEQKFLKTVWPGLVSVIVSCPQKSLHYLHRGTKSLAFRLPDDLFMQTLLKKTGPLVAPSANPQGKEPAQTRTKAQNYFGSNVDFYCGSSTKKGFPSTIVSLVGGKPVIIRQGRKQIVIDSK